jgi:hypothetical protein
MTKTQTRKQYVVVYRMGGRDNFRWQRTLAFDSFESAADARNGIWRGGRPAYVTDIGLSYAIGVPDTFDAEDVFQS